MPSKLPRARIVIAGREYCRRMPADATPADFEQARRELREEVEQRPPAPKPGNSFRRDALDYLAAVLAMPSYADRKRDIDLWIAEFGDRPRSEITSAMIRTARDRWLVKGPRLVQKWETHPALKRKVRVLVPVEGPLAGSTVNHRLRALENLYTVLDGLNAPNPVREVPDCDEDEQPIRVLPVASIRALFDIMGDSQSKAQLAVLAWTGVPPVALKRITPEMFDRQRRAVWVPGRKKGKGTSGRWLPLTADGVMAFQMIDREGAWGKKTWRNARRTFYVAVKNLGDPVFKGLPPYSLRKAFATRVYQASADHRATQHALGHKSPRTTDKYAAAALDPQLARAIHRLEEAETGAKGRVSNGHRKRKRQTAKQSRRSP